MKIIDISWPISPEMTAYKDRSVVDFMPIKVFEMDGARESLLQLGTHSGTHIDAPSHFCEDGETIDRMPLSALIGPCEVVDATAVKLVITAADLRTMNIPMRSRILFKTSNSQRAATDPFDKNFVYLDASAAQFLVDKKTRAVGIDYLGIERNQPAHDTHILLMNNEVAIIEGLRLQHVLPGSYQLSCLPMAIVGLEAAPARAVLVKL